MRQDKQYLKIAFSLPFALLPPRCTLPQAVEHGFITRRSRRLGRHLRAADGKATAAGGMPAPVRIARRSTDPRPLTTRSAGGRVELAAAAIDADFLVG